MFFKSKRTYKAPAPVFGQEYHAAVRTAQQLAAQKLRDEMRRIALTHPR